MGVVRDHLGPSQESRFPARTHLFSRLLGSLSDRAPTYSSHPRRSSGVRGPNGVVTDNDPSDSHLDLMPPSYLKVTVRSLE